MATISGIFGSTIRDRRRQLYLTQEELSHLINTSVSYISNLEGGRRRASEKVVMKLAEVLGLDAHELLLFAIPKIGPQPRAGNREKPRALHHKGRYATSSVF